MTEVSHRNAGIKTKTSKCFQTWFDLQYEHYHFRLWNWAPMQCSSADFQQYGQVQGPRGSKPDSTLSVCCGGPLFLIGGLTLICTPWLPLLDDDGSNYAAAELCLHCTS